MSEAEWTEMFKMMDESGTGSIPSAKFGTAVRAAGQYPTQAQVKEMLDKADSGGMVSMANYLEQMKWISKKNPLDIEKIGESFQMFDKDDNGLISKSELQHVLTSMGDKLTTEEADEFIKEASADKNGLIKYMDFLNSVTE
jgi:Ca2+-binding EF-hand superfamily protein